VFFAALETVMVAGQLNSPTPPESPLSQARLAERLAASRPARPLRVVMLDEELPYPPNSGKRIRTLNLTLRLARRHQITYICHRNADPVEAACAAAFFREKGVATVVVDRAAPPRSGPGFYARLAANLLSPLPYSVTSHGSRALRDAVKAHERAHAVDLWHCEWTPLAEALSATRGGRRLVMAHNVESLIWQRYHEHETGRLRRWYIRGQWRKFVRFERRALTGADHVVAVSPEDAAVFRDQFGARQVSVVDNGVDTAYFRPGAGPREARRILFLGSLDWRPNLDAVDQLVKQVFPAVRAAVPLAKLWLVGRNPPEELRRRLFSFPNVELHADVADVRPFLNGCGLLAVPLRIGGGSRLKILEALASGVPVVSTRVGAEGLSLEPGRHLTVTADVADMAPAITSVIRSHRAALAQAAAGRQRVLERYDWDVLADRLERVWLECAGLAAPGPTEARGEAA
jgi:glycosyltransferase involved in cell wall biosynthesis